MEQKNKILIVDDEKGFTSMLQLNLESLGNFVVRVENNSERAIETALAFEPHVILLDVIMPNMEGPDIAQAIKVRNILKETAIIFLTATITKEEAATQDGLISNYKFVAKPSNIRILLETIQQSLASINDN